MPSIRLIKRRIRSVQNTAKITNAISMVAASKMRRAQLRGLQGRPYAEQISTVISHLAALPNAGEEPQPLLDKRPVKRIAYIHITADRGLCGPLNSNMNRAGFQFIQSQSVPVGVVAVGRRGREFMARGRGAVKAVFTDLGDAPGLLDTVTISKVIMDDFIKGEIDEVYLGYSLFVNTVVQRPVIERLLPVEPKEEAQDNRFKAVDYIYEPNPQEVLEALLPRYVEMLVYHAILEHIASEQSAKMVAMRNASEAAKDMILSLTQTYNKVRQEMITKEILDLVGGAAAITG